jgi:hypothetical protein
VKVGKIALDAEKNGRRPPTKMEDDLKQKVEENLNKNGRRPQLKMKMEKIYWHK